MVEVLGQETQASPGQWVWVRSRLGGGAACTLWGCGREMGGRAQGRRQLQSVNQLKLGFFSGGWRGQEVSLRNGSGRQAGVTFKNLASGIRHPWALLPPLLRLGYVTSGRLLHLSGSQPFQLSSKRTAVATTQVVGKMTRSNNEIHSHNDRDHDCQGGTRAQK